MAKKDLTGQRFGKLVAIRPTGRILGSASHRGAEWECLCDCGKSCAATTRQLIWGGKKSCGCAARKQRADMIVAAHAACFRDGTHIGRIAAENRPQRNNTSGIRGVSWHKARQKWQVRIMFQRQTHLLGYTDTLEEAAKLRKAGEERYYKKYLDRRESEDK